MDQRRMYLSHAPEDAEHVRRLLAVLEAAGITTVAGQPDAIASAELFVACFSSDSGEVARWQHDELQRAIDHARVLPPDARWITLVKLTPCVVPSLPGVPANAPVFDLQGRWAESIAHLIAPPPAAASSATFTWKSERVHAGGDAKFTNVNQAAAPGTNAHSELTINDLVVDGNLDFTNVRN